MPHVLSLRSVTVNTLLGHMVAVPAGTPTFMPAMALPRALELGCVECDEKGQLSMSAEIIPQIPVTDIPQLSLADRDDPEKRATVLILAVAKLYNENDKSKFTLTTNLPKVAAVEALTGFPTSVKEIGVAIEQFHAAKSG